MSASNYVTRQLAIRSARKAISSGMALEAVLGTLYDNGYIEGSEQSEVTAYDREILAVIANTGTPTLVRVANAAPKLAEAINNQRMAEMNHDLDAQLEARAENEAQARAMLS